MINETIILLLRSYDPEYRREFQNVAEKHPGAQVLLPLPLDLYFFKPLQKIFSKVILYDHFERMVEKGIRAVNEEIIDLVRKERPKYFIWLSGAYDVQESTLDAIRQEGTIVVVLFFDDEYRFDEYTKWWLPYLDYCVTHNVEMLPRYQELDARVIYVLSAIGVALDRDWSKIEEKYDVSFVGAKKYDREQYINELKKRNIPARVFGQWWGAGSEGYVSFEEMLDIFATSKINLSFSKTGDNKLGIKGKVVEVCLAGGFLLTEYVPGIENYFEIDQEIVCFQNAAEMADKIVYYLNHEAERRAIAQAGWRRATGEHTTFHMLSRIFSEIEEDIAARGRESHPPKLKMPMPIRRRFSSYYLRWAIAFSEENHKGFWKGALALSLRYYPFNTVAWYHYIISFLPYPIRIAVIRLGRAFSSRLSSVRI